MKRSVSTVLSLIAAFSVHSAANAVEGTIGLSAIVPVVCNVRFEPGLGATNPGSAVALGSVHEMCNASNGYRLYVDYEQGKLVGSTVQIGNQNVTLDGSGTAILTSSALPGNQTRSIAITPGSAGFDTSVFSLRITAS